MDTGDAALPVAGSGVLSAVRPSRNSRRRAIVLVVLHLLIAAHATHFLVAGRTVSPVEPSEAMYTLELGQMNAGFIFLLAALLATLVFGRFVCGWGCHIVAVQDLCGWFMKRLGVRPRPFRSRLLVWAPLVAAIYMFVWPTVHRLFFAAAAQPFPGFTDHLMTASFWKTFPGPLFTVLTIATCGFAAVYFLGAKGFCTYGCPYGGLFGVVDRLSPGRIVVDDRCEQCGHCTVTCTSNVLVHEEVRRFGQVVDPGCMKCLDCVSVCPKGALRFSWGWPSLFKRSTDDRRARRYTLGLGEELAAGALFLGGCLAFRGLYDGPPLLMSIGLGGITAFVALKLWRLWRSPDVRLQNLRLKAAGRVAFRGKLFAVTGMLWLLFTAHSGFVQWHRFEGRRWLNRTEAGRAEVLSGSFAERTLSSAHQVASAKLLRHFSLADRWGLVDVVEVKLGLAWGEMLRGEADRAEAAIRAAIAARPEDSKLHDNLVEFLAARGRATEAVDALRGKVEVAEPTAEDHFLLASLLAGLGRLEESVAPFEQAVEADPDTFAVRYNFGGVLRRLERHAAAIEQLTVAAALAPGDPDTQIELGLAHMALGDSAAALTCFRYATTLAPDSPEARLHLPELIRQLESGN